MLPVVLVAGTIWFALRLVDRLRPGLVVSAASTGSHYRYAERYQRPLRNGPS
jgi:hypothetical protein